MWRRRFAVVSPFEFAELVHNASFPMLVQAPVDDYWK